MKVLKYLVYVFTCALTLYNIINIKTRTEYDINGNEIIYLIPESMIYGGFALILVFVFIVLKSRSWKSIFAVILLLGTFKLIQFSPTTTTFMGIETTVVILLFVHLSLNSEIFDPIKKVLKTVLVLKDEPVKELDETVVKIFEDKFARKSIEELTHISESGQYSPEAIEAASRLMIKTGYKNQ